MEPISTLDLGISSGQGLLRNQATQLRNLANKARHLSGPQSSDKGYHLRGTGALSLKNEKPTPQDKDKKLMEVAQKFESLLIHQMLKAMRKTVNKSDLLNSFSLQQYESMMDEEIANEMAKQKGIGLADMLFYQLSRLEAEANPQAEKATDNVSHGVISHE